MNTETENAGATGRRGHAWQIAVGAVVCMVLAVLLVLPGFMAAWFSKRNGVVLLNNVIWMGLWGTDKEPMALQVEMGILTPSEYLMLHSKPMRQFYRWEYRLAGGEEIHDPKLTTAFKLPPD
ncbi:MAG TPA: hypothetical protein VG733_04030 [Chthoniobacteraceae bacterium]|nr:hypothetical protein [Chthoniobacteraceae bacterium]